MINRLQSKTLKIYIKEKEIVLFKNVQVIHRREITDNDYILKAIQLFAKENKLSDYKLSWELGTEMSKRRVGLEIRTVILTTDINL